ncbi:MAG: metal ABC transporter permease [Bacteroidota bacterium]
MDIVLATIVIAFLAAVNCGLIGSFLMLRGQSMMGDAISHAVLPGIVLAFILTKSRAPMVMLIGAIGAAALMSLMVAFLKVTIKISHEAAIGISFTSFFALGIVLLAIYAQKVDLDMDCVLYGSLSLAGFKTWGDMGPLDMYILLGLLLGNVTFIFIAYPSLVLTSFDHHFAQSVGVRTQRWYYTLILLTAVNTVFIFSIVGAPLVLGFLVIPPAIAYLFVPNVTSLLLYTLAIDVILAVFGHLLAASLDCALPGAMITVGGILFVMVFIFMQYSPKKAVAKPAKEVPV